MRNVISHAATFWIRSPRVALEKVKTPFVAAHAAGRHLSFWRRPKLTVVRLSLEGLDDSIFGSAAELARTLACEVAVLYAMTGTAEYAMASAYDAKGDELWSEASPERTSAESRRVERALGVRLLSDAQAERLDENDELDEDAEFLRHLPYWKLHLELGLPGRRPLVDLSLKPALEMIGSGWTELETWLTPEQQARARANAAAADAARPKIEAALAKLAQRARGQRVTVFTADDASVAVCTEKLQDAAVKKFASRSIVLRKSKLARKTGARLHPQALLREKVDVDRFELMDGLTLELVQKYFGPKIEVAAPWGWKVREGAFESDEGDPEANAWNSLIELSNAEVVQALGESREEGIELFFSNQLRDQIREYLKADPPLFAPLLAEALLAKPDNEELDTFNWLLLEPSVKKKHATNARYKKTLRKLWEKTQTPRYLDALKRVGG